MAKRGRPELYPEVIRASLSPQMRIDLRKHAAAEEVPESEIVRRALRKELAK